MERTTLLILFFVSTAVAAKFPASLQRCPLSVSDNGKSNTCLKEAIQKAIGVLSSTNGLPELGLPTLDPLDIKQLTISQGGANRPVSINLNFRNNQLLGLSNVKVQTVETKLSPNKDLEVKLVFNLDKVVNAGPYDITGNILILPIQGKGENNMTFIDLRLDYFFKGKPYMKKGKEYLKLSDFAYSAHPKRVYFELTNLFNGNKALGDNMNRFLNNNWEPIYSDLKPAQNEAMTKIYAAYTKAILEKIPYNELFDLE